MYVNDWFIAGSALRCTQLPLQFYSSLGGQCYQYSNSHASPLPSLSKLNHAEPPNRRPSQTIPCKSYCTTFTQSVTVFLGIQIHPVITRKLVDREASCYRTCSAQCQKKCTRGLFCSLRMNVPPDPHCQERERSTSIPARNLITDSHMSISSIVPPSGRPPPHYRGVHSYLLSL